MRKLRAWMIRILATLRMHRTRAEIDTELSAHIAMSIEDGVRAGLSAEEARRRALLQLGGEEQARQAYRDRAIVPLLEGIAQDIRFALRQMRKAPVFTLTAILTLALGIGANSVIYTLVDSILLRPLPYVQQDRLMRIGYGPDNEAFFPKGWVRALAEHASSFAAISAFGADTESNITEGDRPERIFGAQVMVNALDTLGIQPVVGRFFSADDAIAGHEPVVVLNHEYWQQHFAQSPLVIGQTIQIDGEWRRIIGVMPSGVRFPYADTQFVTPVTFKGGDPIDPWNNFSLFAFGRLKDSVNPTQAQAELRHLHGELLPLFPWRMPDIWAANMTVVPLLESETGAMRPRLLLLFGAVGLILLIACANVANMMLARATAREREIAIRGALGASGLRLVQQLLSESIVLGLAAGAVGLGSAFFSLRLFVRLLPVGTPRVDSISLHPADVLFTLAASMLAGLLFGLIPSLRMASPNLLETLRLGSRGLTGRGSRFGASMFLVMIQIGLSVVVITVAGLVLHSLYNLARVDPGFRTDHIVTAEVALDSSACKQAGHCQSFFDTLLNNAHGIVGVQDVALTDSLPLSGRDGNYVYDAEDHPRDPRQGALMATGRTVSPEYFSLLGLQLVRGRLFGSQDASGASRAVVINEHMAQQLWPNQNPLGKRLLRVTDEAKPAVWNDAKASVVVGIVRNAREGSLEGGFDNEVFLPMTPEREQPVMYVLLRTHVTSAEAADSLRRVVTGIDSQVPVTRVRTLNEVVANSVAAPRALAVLLLGFGALALIIGAVGVYSLIAYIVSWRVREIGLRLALGAQRWQIVMAVVRQSLLLAGSGCAVGLLATIALSRVLRSFLFEVGVLDPLTLCAVPLLMLVVALAAAWIPARRAAAVDPMVALRAD